MSSTTDELRATRSVRPPSARSNASRSAGWCVDVSAGVDRVGERRREDHARQRREASVRGAGKCGGLAAGERGVERRAAPEGRPRTVSSDRYYPATRRNASYGSSQSVLGSRGTLGGSQPDPTAGSFHPTRRAARNASSNSLPDSGDRVARCGRWPRAAPATVRRCAATTGTVDRGWHGRGRRAGRSRPPARS